MLGRRFRSDYAQASAAGAAGHTPASPTTRFTCSRRRGWPSRTRHISPRWRASCGASGTAASTASYYLDNAGQSGLGFPDVTRDPSLGQAHLVFQVQNGTHRIISPQPYAESTFRVPSRRADPPVAGWPTEVSGSARD